MSSARITNIWLVLALLMVLPPIFSVLDRTDETPFPVALLASQAVVGTALGLSSLISLRRQRIHISLLVMAIVTTAYAGIATVVIIPLIGVSPIGIYGYLHVLAPISICLVMTIATFLAYWGGGRKEGG